MIVSRPIQWWSATLIPYSPEHSESVIADVLQLRRLIQYHLRSPWIPDYVDQRLVVKEQEDIRFRIINIADEVCGRAEATSSRTD